MSRTLSCHGLTKTYGKITVVKAVDLQLNAGEIHAVVGENGAGKSTLMNMMAGVTPPTEGTISIDGQRKDMPTPRSAAEAGIAIVHQELQVVQSLSIADNIMLVRPPAAAGALRGSKREYEFVSKLLARVGIKRNPGVKTAQLSAAEAQLLEVAKALALEASFIIFDEPTSALPPAEAESLLTLVEGLRDEGHGILYISHHLSEITRIADQISVLRDGNLVGNLSRADADIDRIIHLMVDRPVSLYANDLSAPGERIVFEAEDAATPKVSGLTFKIRSGEILGFAGLIGSGMHEAALAVAGGDRLISGFFRIGGEKVFYRSPYQAARCGISLVPEERKEQAIIPEMSVHDNLHVGRYGLFAQKGVLNLARLRRRTDELVNDFNIRIASRSQAVCTLSGGNQQKVVVARCVQADPNLLVVCEPTRGVDIGAKDEIHRRIIRLASEGKAIIVVSSELDEVLALSHRVAVFSEGRMAGLLEKDDATPQQVMHIATPKAKSESGRLMAA